MMQNKNETDHSRMTVSIMCSDALCVTRLCDANVKDRLAEEEGVAAGNFKSKLQGRPPVYLSASTLSS